MKTFLLLLLSLFLVSPVFAQKIITKTLPLAADQAVHLDLKFGDSIQVRYWDKPDVSVRIAATINNGKLNDALLVETASTAQAVSLKADFDKELIKQGKAEDCPGTKNQSTWRTDKNGDSYSVCSTINYIVFLPRKAALRVETINGNIDIQGATNPVWAKSISGFVDMSWAGNKGANVALKTITGEVYSDLSIEFKNKREKHPIVGYLLEGTVLSGGPEVRLESISNNIFLRKEK
ncbi:hypothetical protein [Fibrivirga algicola]|uniref:Adhesin domain-containing protein n=1 Tax=Fibrivirga algicola TaxID=2950420 RepID=A0ABX0QLM7_9BACT|nr:hypothetical protein [Fibrivirga algicola]ARK12663.1 hypothetical protein A6C57_21275 [Fibrella sp. ES10-3-2-2]NID12171.1 hypothetical protein [Fibrivirga algicola]